MARRRSKRSKSDGPIETLVGYALLWAVAAAVLSAWGHLEYGPALVLVAGLWVAAQGARLWTASGSARKDSLNTSRQRTAHTAKPERAPTASRRYHQVVTSRSSPPPRAPAVDVSSVAVQDGARYWRGDGHVGVAGVTFPSRLIYLGRGLRSVSGFGVEPALIDPGLDVDIRNPDVLGRSMTYWPSYSGMSASARGAYVKWLAGGRTDPSAYIGYVFLYFYGLERRALVDARHVSDAAEDVPVIAEEVRRLLALYPESRSYRGYARDFLGALAFLFPKAGGDSNVRSFTGAEPLPLVFRLLLGLRASEGRPLDSDQALAWYLSSPAATGLRIPVRRLPPQFADLFRTRFMESYPDGFLVPPPRARIGEITYRPASASFGGMLRLGSSDLPDVTVATTALRSIDLLAQRCANDLALFVRHVGQSGPKVAGPSALYFLPVELVKADPVGRATIESLGSLLRGSDFAVVETQKLLSVLGLATPTHRTTVRTSLVRAFDFAERLGYGIEPDPRYGSRLVDGSAVLFAVNGDHVPFDPAYASATAIVEAAAAVALADGVIDAREWPHLESAIRLSGLGEAAGRRLRAHLKWLEAARPRTADLRSRLASLNEARRGLLAEILIAVAGSDGRIEAREINALKRAFAALGLSEAQLYSAAHALGAPQVGRRDEGEPGAPVVVVPKRDSSTYTLPPVRPTPPTVDTSGFALNMALVQAKLQDSERVSALLGGVFAEEPEAMAAPEARRLDERYRRLLVTLATRPSWTRSEFQDAAAAEGLMPDGAMESINEAAFEIAGAPILDEGETIEIDSDLLKEMLA